MDTPVLFRDLAVIFAAALLGGLFAWRLRLPLILGFVAGGILISPFTPGPSISDPHSFALFAEIGVVLLMFTVGLEFSIGELLKVKWVALLGAPLGITLSLGVGTLTSELMGWPFKQGLVIGAVISVASTMVMIRLLMDRGDQNSLQGHVMIGITLIEDFAVVIMTVLLPTLAGEGKIHPGQIAWTLGKAFLLLIPVVLITIKGIPPLLAWVAKTKDQELFLLAALTISLGTASLTHAAGLSAAFGAFLAGLVISGSKYTHQTLAQLLPMRNAFVALFFVTVGALIEPQELFSSLGLLATMLVLILAGKMMVWTLVVRLFGYPFWTAVAVAIGLTQIGEFSFLLVEVARTSGLVGRDVYNATLAASLITILLNAFLMRYAPRWIPKHPSVVPAKAA